MVVFGVSVGILYGLSVVLVSTIVLECRVPNTATGATKRRRHRLVTMSRQPPKKP